MQSVSPGGRKWLPSLVAAQGGRYRSQALLVPTVANYFEMVRDPIMAGSWRWEPCKDIQASGYVAHSLEASL